MFGVTAEQAAGGSPDLAWLRASEAFEKHFYSAGDRLPVGVEAFPGSKPNGVVLWVVKLRAVVVGDTVVDFGRGLEPVGCANSVHAATLYSWSRPPRRSRRRTTAAERSVRDRLGSIWSGGARSSERCGRWLL